MNQALIFKPYLLQLCSSLFNNLIQSIIKEPKAPYSR